MLPSIPNWLKRFVKYEVLYLVLFLTFLLTLLPPVLLLFGMSQQEIVRMDGASEYQMKLLKNRMILEYMLNQLIYSLRHVIFACLILIPLDYFMRRDRAKSKFKLEIIKEILDGFIAGEIEEVKFKHLYLEQIRFDEDILYKKELEILKSLFGNSSDDQTTKLEPQTNTKPLLERAQELRTALNAV
jgi:hypothetical protein